MLWLLLLVIAISFTPRLLAYLLQPKIEITYGTFSQVKSELNELSGDKAEDFHKRTSTKVKRDRYRSPKSKFDPNSYKLSDWMKLGLSEKQANVIVNFSKRGIKDNAELSRIFVIDSELFTLIRDSTVYPVTKEIKSQPEKNKIIEVVNLNSASKEELMSVRGVGEYYANKIIDYRSKLGGFVRKEQLMELWKFDEVKYDKVKDQVSVKGEPEKININTASIEDLKNHPYVRYKEANAIVKFRDQHGLYKNIEEIKQSDWIDDTLFEKMQPYLTVEQ